MSYVDISLAKAHLALSHSADDVLVQQCLDAAEAHCAKWMNRSVIADPQDRPWSAASASSSSESGSVVPASVIQAVLIYTGEFYEQRLRGISGTIYAVMPTADALLAPYRIGHGI